MLWEGYVMFSHEIHQLSKDQLPGMVSPMFSAFALSHISTIHNTHTIKLKSGRSMVVGHVPTVHTCLVFQKKDLYLIITQKLTFMKSGGFQVKSTGFHLKSTQNLIKSDVSTKTLQFGACMEGAPLLHSSNWIVLVETPAFTRFWVDFT